MTANDRRTSRRREASLSPNVTAGTAMTMDRRAVADRRRMPRRRTDARTIAEYAATLALGETRLEVIVAGAEGLRLVAMFACSCRAIEPIGTGKPAVRVESCAEHRAPRVPRERRRSS